MSAAEISPQLILFAVSVLSGFVMGGIYDIIRIFRRVIPHTAFFMFVEDLIFWIIASLAVFVVMLAMNAGEVRFFAIGGFFIGNILYFLILSPVVIGISEKIIYITKKILLKIFSIFCIPFKILSKFSHRILYPFKTILTKFKQIVKNHLKNNPIYAKIFMYIQSRQGKEKKPYVKDKKNERT